MFASVVIPVRNAVDRLLYTLYSLNLQYTSFDDFEVIVLDNASTDEIAAKIKSFQTNYILHYVPMRQRCSHYRLCNEGVAKAKGDVLIFLGCDLIVPRDFIGTHLQAHAQDSSLVLLGMAPSRIYSVYYPYFAQQQHMECHKWLENYPQIKRPHTLTKIVSLLDEKQIAGGLPFRISLPCSQSRKWELLMKRYGPKLENCKTAWTLFQTDHASLKQTSFHKLGLCKGLQRREMEREFARRLWKANYTFHVLNKLTLVRQEHPPLRISNQKRNHL